MTVKELKSILETADENMEVLICLSDYDYPVDVYSTEFRAVDENGEWNDDEEDINKKDFVINTWK